MFNNLYIPMLKYHKILRRLNSHPKFALDMVRQINRRHKSVCKKCGCLGGLEIHHTDKRGIVTYRCKECHRTFSELYGTIFYRSKVSIDKWLIVLMEWCLSTGSISAAEASRRIGVSYDTAWSMLMKIRSLQSQ